VADAWGDSTWGDGGWGGLTPGVASGWGSGPWSSRAWGGIDTDRALTGSSASGSAGVVTAAFPDVTAALTGILISGYAGNIVREVSQALSGAAGSGAVGSTGVIYEITPNGRTASGFTGVISFGGTTTALTGASAAQGLTGTPTPNITAFYTGTISGATGWGSGAWSDASWGGAGVLTVNSASANAGTVVSQVAPSLTGSSGFAVPGSVTFEMAFPLSGQVISGFTGTWTPGKAAFLTGASDALGRTGTVVVVKSVSINGNPATGAAGSLGYAYWQLIPDSQNPNWTDIITV
jgi:hypothetical protein